MVSLDSAITIRSIATTSTLGRCVDQLITGDIQKVSEAHEFLNEIEKAVVRTCKFISLGDKKGFAQEYSDFSKRVPSEHTVFQYNDFLLFVLICGVRKFEMPIDWLIQVLDSRVSSEPEIARIVTTFKNVLNDNLESKSNYHQIGIVLNFVLGRPIGTSKILSSSFDQVAMLSPDSYSNELLLLVSYHGFRLIISNSDLSQNKSLERLEDFEKHFIKRSKGWSIVLYFLIVVTIFTGIFLLAKKMNILEDNSIKDMSLIDGVELIGLMGGFVFFVFSKARNWTIQFIQTLIYLMWGYSK